MIKNLFACLLVFLCFQTMAQEVVYDKNVELRKVGSFSAIEVSGSITLYLSQANDNAVAVSAGEEKYNEKIKTEVNKGVLSISVDGGIWNAFSLANRKLVAYVSVKELEKISISGASFFVINGSLTGKSLQVEIAGASEIKGKLQLESLKLEIAGASVARFSGNVKNASIEASGACKISGYDLKLENCKTSASGSSSIQMTVTKTLKADASGGSTIYFKGTPSETKLSASPGSSIKNKGDGD